MDRNEKSPLEWDWENHGLFSAEKEVEISEFGNRSSKSSILASIDSSSKEGLKISKSGLSKKKELTSVEPLIGLILGKRTYFEDVTSIGNNSTKNSTCSTSPVPPTALVKKTRVSHQSIPNSCCQVEGCGIDLSGAKDYHRKNRVCESHSKCPKVIIAGLERRFCQQCSRFHDLREFDLKKRSCRRRLSDHNARRRKPQSDLSFNSTGLSSPFYGDRHKMDFLINRPPYGHMRPTASSTWEDSCGFSITHSKGSWIKTTKAGGLDAQLQFSNSKLSNAVSALCRDLDKILSFKGAPAEVFTQGDRHKMNFLINRSPFGHMRPTANSTWEDSCGFSITHTKGSWIKTTKAVGLDAQLQFSNSELSNAVPALCRDLDKILSFKGAPAEVFTQGALLDGSDRIGFGLAAQIGLDFIWRPGFSLGLAWWSTLARVWLNSSEMACIWLGSSNRFVFWLSSSYWSASAGSSDQLVFCSATSWLRCWLVRMIHTLTACWPLFN